MCIYMVFLYQILNCVLFSCIQIQLHLDSIQKLNISGWITCKCDYEKIEPKKNIQKDNLYTQKDTFSCRTTRDNIHEACTEREEGDGESHAEHSGVVMVQMALQQQQL